MHIPRMAPKGIDKAPRATQKDCKHMAYGNNISLVLCPADPLGSMSSNGHHISFLRIEIPEFRSAAIHQGLITWLQ